MIKYLCILLFLSISFASKSQNPSQQVPTQFSTGWFRQGWPQADSGTILANRLPNFTPRFPGTTILYQHAGVDSNINFWNGARWIDLIPGFDSTSLSNRINLKLNTVDTADHWWGLGKRWVDTVYRVNDSTIGFTINNGAEQTFQILGGASGGGGTGTVTSVALSLPSAFSVSGSPITTSGTFNVSGAGTSAQYIRGNGTLATTDTGMIPNFYLKVRGLLSGTSPITYNSTTGAIGIPDADISGTKGAATFNSASFLTNGSGLISLSQPVPSGACTNCDITWGSDGRPTAYSNGSGGGGSATLQEVTTNGDSTSNKMYYLNNPYFLIADSNSIPSKKYIDARQESFLGRIYEKNSWSNMNDFTLVGGIIADTSGGKISISGGAGTFTSTLDINWFSILERWKMLIRFKVTNATSSTSYGIGIGIHSTNTYGAVNALGRIDLTDGATSGKVILNGHTDNQQMAISPDALPFTQNDTIELRVERKVDSIYIYAINRTQSNATVMASFQYNLISGIPQLPNTGRFSIFAFGGTQLIDSISVTSEEIKNATSLTQGDSKTQGYYAQSFPNRFTTKFNNKVPTTVIHAGGYDRTTEWLTTLPEIKLLNPKQVLLTNPSNDLRSGLSDSASQANYIEIVDSLTSWGINVFHGLAFYETSQDNSGWNAFVLSTFNASNIIDFWSPTKNCSGCIAGDGVHLTELGNDTVYQTQLWSYKEFGGSNNSLNNSISFSGTDNTIAMFLGGSLVNSYIYQDNDRAYISKGFESNSTDPGFDIYKSNAGIDEKGWITYSDNTNLYIATFNDTRNAVYNAIKLNRTGNSVNYMAVPQPLVVGQATDPGTYMQSIVSAGAAILRLRTSNATGEYIGFEQSTTPKGYIGFGSSLTTGANENDITLRSQDDTINFSNNAGANMVKIAAGKLYVTAHDIGSNSDSALTWNRTTNAYEYAKINGTSAITIYSGDGTLGGNRTVTGSSNSLTFNGLFNYRINANAFILDKSTVAAPYTLSVLGTDNRFQLGYTPTATVYSKGAAIVIDSNNNAGLGVQMPTTAPLYSTGLNAFTNNLLVAEGQFNGVSNITSSTTISLNVHFIRIDATSGNVTVTLPAASSAFGSSMGIHYVFKRLDNSVNTVTVQRNGTPGTDTIDGASSITLTTQYEVKELQCSSTSTWDVK